MKTQEKKEWWLYGLVNPRTGSIRYCGQSCQPKVRAATHRRKYPSLEMRQIGVCNTLEEVLVWEWLMVEILDCPLNEMAGGGSPPPMTKERAQNPAWRKANAEANRKKAQCPKWRKATKERSQCPEWRKVNKERALKKQGKMVRAFCIATGEVLEFRGQGEAAEQMRERYKKKFKQCKVSEVCNWKNGRTQHHGWRFEFVAVQ